MHVQILCIFDSAVDLFAILSPAGRPAAGLAAGRPAGQYRVHRPAVQTGWLVDYFAV